jgi:hypothetical protein
VEDVNYVNRFVCARGARDAHRTTTSPPPREDGPGRSAAREHTTSAVATELVMHGPRAVQRFDHAAHLLSLGTRRTQRSPPANVTYFFFLLGALNSIVCLESPTIVPFARRAVAVNFTDSLWRLLSNR